MGNACYYSVEKLLSSSLLSKNLNVRIYKTVILPVVLYGCETWTLTLREEHRLRVFENKVFRKIFGAKRDEVTGEWKKLHNTEVHALYSSPDIIRNIKSRRLRWTVHVNRMGESRNAYRVLVGRSEGKRPLGRPRRRWEDNIKMDLREVGYDDRDWIDLAQDWDQWRAYVRAAMNLRVLKSEKIFGAKRDEVTEEWRKLHNTELHALYSSPNIRPEEERPLGRPRRIWEDNIKMDLREDMMIQYVDFPRDGVEELASGQRVSSLISSVDQAAAKTVQFGKLRSLKGLLIVDRETLTTTASSSDWRPDPPPVCDVILQPPQINGICSQFMCLNLLHPQPEEHAAVDSTTHQNVIYPMELHSLIKASAASLDTCSSRRQMPPIGRSWNHVHHVLVVDL
ncbi:hypothetical protein ANN_17998 [Periplaneta americana]|uniref:Uncharacterized protein n=1 Tax=Periplaneta americana TaxID=6978 RepID=A0ABQ8SMI0_PERAM|nr:hypothetical protein ANN_17998 [Periplaneta americana]